VISSLFKQAFVCFVVLMCCNNIVSASTLGLSWDANTESHIDHYRIHYRIGGSGGRNLINYSGSGLDFSGAPLISGMTEVDKDKYRHEDTVTVSVENVDPSEHYCFVVTAVSIWNQESEASNEACKIEIDAPELSLQPTAGDLMPVLSTTGWKLITGDDYLPVGDRTTEWQISSDPGFSDADLIFVLETMDPTYLEAIDVPGLVLSPSTRYHARVRFQDSVLGTSAWSNVITDIPGPDPDDNNGDGIPDDNVPDDTVDLDGDGVNDMFSDTYRAVYTAVGNNVIGVEVPAGVKIDILKAMAPNEISAVPPPGLELSYGLIEFRLSNAPVPPGDVQVTILPLHAITGIVKYDLLNGWHPANATNNGDGTWVLTLIDGGEGDTDGVENGIIVDPSGLITGSTQISTSQVGVQGGGGGGCFIATAAFGSGWTTHVQILKRFRDEFLISSSIGKDFIDLYYHTSPPIADYIKTKPGIKQAVRLALLPIIGIAYLFMFVHPAIIVFCLVILASYSVMRFRGKGIGI